MCRPSSSGWSGLVTDHQGSVMAWDAMVVVTLNTPRMGRVEGRAAHCAHKGSSLHCVSRMLPRMLLPTAWVSAVGQVTVPAGASRACKQDSVSGCPLGMVRGGTALLLQLARRCPQH